VATGIFEQTLTTAVIDGVVYQNASSPTNSLPEDNVIEGNRYESTRLSNRYYGLSEAIRTIMKDNFATGGAEVGIIFRCTLDSSRLCLSPGDCHLPLDGTTSKGSCVGITLQDIDWPGEDNVLEGNDLRGPFTRSGIAPERASGSQITGNTVTGPFVGNAVNDAGITLRGKLPIETSVVTRNRVSGNGPALFLHQGQGQAGAVASFFGSTVSLNDLTGYTIVVRTNSSYNLSTELSDPMTLQGNYRGIPCPGSIQTWCNSSTGISTRWLTIATPTTSRLLQHPTTRCQHPVASRMLPVPCSRQAAAGPSTMERSRLLLRRHLLHKDSSVAAEGRSSCRRDDPFEEADHGVCEDVIAVAGDHMGGVRHVHVLGMRALCEETLGPLLT
jgi:hypothetical protein